MNIHLEYHEKVQGKMLKKELAFNQNLLSEPYSLNSLFVSKVEGESMQPLIKDKSLVVADLSQNEFAKEAVFLIYKDNKTWIKKASLINDREFFISINPQFSHLVYSRDECRIIAKAVLHFSG